MPDKLREVINILYSYDPVKLRSPKNDEYGSEATDIVGCFENTDIRPISIEETQRYLYLIFNLSFNSSSPYRIWKNSGVGTFQSYRNIAEDIWNLFNPIKP